MKFLFLEPFFGGSHRYFSEGLSQHSRYRIDLVTLPARFWNWRMRGAALYFLKNPREAEAVGKRAYQAVLSHQGAAPKHAAVIYRLLKNAKRLKYPTL